MVFVLIFRLEKFPEADDYTHEIDVLQSQDPSGMHYATQILIFSKYFL